MIMSSSQRNVDFILEQIAGAGTVSARRMFGEWGLYCDGRLVALVCDDRLFVKPTEAGREFLGEVELAQPYPQAKPWYLVAEEKWDEASRLAQDIIGAAGGLGLSAVTQAAREFTKLAREGESHHQLRNAAQTVVGEHVRVRQALIHLYPDVA